jgi:hypothetical protein
MQWRFSRAFTFQLNNFETTKTGDNPSYAIGYLFGSVCRTGCVIHCCMAIGPDCNAGEPEIVAEITDLLSHLPSGQQLDRKRVWRVTMLTLLQESFLLGCSLQDSLLI